MYNLSPDLRNHVFYVGYLKKIKAFLVHTTLYMLSLHCRYKQDLEESNGQTYGLDRTRFR